MLGSQPRCFRVWTAVAVTRQQRLTSGKPERIVCLISLRRTGKDCQPSGGRWRTMTSPCRGVLLVLELWRREASGKGPTRSGARLQTGM